ncbi:MAG TPA: AMP-binding protein [Gemmatimonadaceae bacterium]|jgi:acyl-CoA synthetase (AMP-forming)/AMP-acid ligase II|nr:AMP-binding protein [Gemmatimonadaceae bacterium]
MPNPLSLISLAAAARGGSIDGIDSRQLVAAGVTMLQRCAPLVRELAAGRGAVLLENSPAYLVALAACEGRGAVLVDPNAPAEEMERVLEETGARVVFTVERCAGSLGEGVARVLLDELPGHVVFEHGPQRRRVDVGSHFGLEIEGEDESMGSDEEAVVARETAGAPFRSYTHRELLAAARGMVSAAGIEEGNEVSASVPFHEARGLAYGLLAPLLAGARVVTRPESGGVEAPPSQLL